jgi:hypothetical protein
MSEEPDAWQAIFARLATRLAPGGRIVVEVSNVRTADGFRPLASQLGRCYVACFARPTSSCA